MASYRKRDGSWEYRISYKTADGKYKQKSKRGYRTKAEAQRAAAEVERELSGRLEIDDTVTLADYFDQWAEIHKKPHVSTVTWKVYQYTSKKIKKYFGKARLRQITASAYQQVLNDHSATHAQDTVERFNIHIKQAVAMALHEGVITKDFTAFAKIKSIKQGFEAETKFLELPEYLQVIQTCKTKMDVQSYALIYIIAITGMRFAEALGLTWDDIDTEDKTLEVNKTWDYKSSLGFMPTKTKSSIRKIPLNDDALKVLADYKIENWKENADNRLFSHISNNAVNKSLKKIVGRDVHVHSLRHTYASFLILNHVELLSISKILGHENMNITIEVYSHQLKQLEQESNDEIRNIFDNFG